MKAVQLNDFGIQNLQQTQVDKPYPKRGEVVAGKEKKANAGFTNSGILING